MKIVIIGCGYIGKEVAEIWKKKGHTVTTTTRKPERLQELSRVSQKGVILKNSDVDILAPLVEENDLIVITIGADSVDTYEDTYLNTSEALHKIANDTKTPKKLIYTSSTSIYGDHHGKWVDEESPLLEPNDRAQILIETEKNYLSLEKLGWEVSILRFAEIYGKEREISKKLKKALEHPLGSDGSQYTNMVHKKDAAGAIDYAFRHHLRGIYNVADDSHPTRKELYDEVSEQLNLPKVTWNPSQKSFHSGNKRVSNHKIKGEGFVFFHPHRVLD